MQETLFDKAGTTNCERCGVQLQVDAVPGSEAKMLRRSKMPKGFCINCAVHDFLRNTYPPNIQLAESGPQILLIPHIQTLFAGIMKAGFADANPDEINWQRIVDNWELPFPNKIKLSSMNPVNQKEIDEIAAGTHPAFDSPDYDRGKLLMREGGVIKSFEQLNELSPGLGDELRKCLRAE